MGKLLVQFPQMADWFFGLNPTVVEKSQDQLGSNNSPLAQWYNAQTYDLWPCCWFNSHRLQIA